VHQPGSSSGTLNPRLISPAHHQLRFISTAHNQARFISPATHKARFISPAYSSLLLHVVSLLGPAFSLLTSSGDMPIQAAGWIVPLVTGQHTRWPAPKEKYERKTETKCSRGTV
jgi:hypothetical protein